MYIGWTLYWTICSFDIFRSRYSFFFHWLLADASEFHLYVAYSLQLVSYLNISYTQLNNIGQAGNGKRVFIWRTLDYILMFSFYWVSVFAWVFCSDDLEKDRGLIRPRPRTVVIIILPLFPIPFMVVAFDELTLLDYINLLVRAIAIAWQIRVLHCPRAGPGRVEAIFAGPDPGPLIFSSELNFFFSNAVILVFLLTFMYC